MAEERMATEPEAGNDSGGWFSRWLLGGALKDLRDAKKWSLDRVAKEMSWSKAKISRIENGEIALRPFDVKNLCEILDAPPELTAELIALAPHTKQKGWWYPYRDAVPPSLNLFLGMEAAASWLRNYESGLVPGLLQTREYAEQIIGAAAPRLTPEQVQKRTDLRMERQRILTRPGAPRLDVILDEAALRRPIANRAAMRGQLLRLANLRDTTETVALRVLPLHVGPTRASTASAFVTLDFAAVSTRRSLPTIVYSEGLTGALYLNEPKEVAAYEETWNELDKVALSTDQSIDLIKIVAEELRDAT